MPHEGNECNGDGDGDVHGDVDNHVDGHVDVDETDVMVTGRGNNDSDSNGPQPAEAPIEENWTHMNNFSPSSVEYNAMPWSQNCVIPEEHMGTGLKVPFFYFLGPYFSTISPIVDRDRQS